MITDPISDMLTRIRNAQTVSKTEVVLPYSRIKFDIAKILEKEGYVGEVATEESNGVVKTLRIALRYDANEPKIHSIKRVSKPGGRVYAKYHELPRVLSGMGMAIVSTPNGLMTNTEARSRKLGGEIICEVY